MMQKGQKATFNFAGQLEDGYEFVNTWLLHEPATAVIGDGTLLPRFEQALAQLERGGRCSVQVPMLDAYGPYDPDLVIAVPKSNFPNADELPVGAHIEFATENGPVRVKIVSVDGEQVTVDCNHELAGHDLAFEIELVDDGTTNVIDQESATTGCGCDKLRESLVGHTHGCCDHEH